MKRQAQFRLIGPRKLAETRPAGIRTRPQHVAAVVRSLIVPPQSRACTIGEYCSPKDSSISGTTPCVE